MVVPSGGCAGAGLGMGCGPPDDWAAGRAVAGGAAGGRILGAVAVAAAGGLTSVGAGEDVAMAAAFGGGPGTTRGARRGPVRRWCSTGGAADGAAGDCRPPAASDVRAPDPADAVACAPGTAAGGRR